MGDESKEMEARGKEQRIKDICCKEVTDVRRLIYPRGTR
jgi:hypothetical protein